MFLETPTQPMDCKLIENLEGIRIAKIHFLSQGIQTGRHMEVALQPGGPFSETFIVCATVFPTLQENLGMRLLRHFHIQRIGFPEQPRHKIHQRWRFGLIAKEASDFLPKCLHQTETPKSLGDRIKNPVAIAVE